MGEWQSHIAGIHEAQNDEVLLQPSWKKYNLPHICSISVKLWKNTGRLVQYEAYGPILLSSLFNHIINTITPKLFSTKEVSNGSLLSFQRFNT